MLANIVLQAEIADEDIGRVAELCSYGLSTQEW
jgi:hypothetical protein